MAMTSKFRYVDDVIRAKSLIASGVLGYPVDGERVHLERQDGAALERQARLRRRRADRQRNAFRRYRPLSPRADRPGARRRGKRSSVAGGRGHGHRLPPRSGVSASIDLSWSLNKELDTYIQIFGSNRTIFVGWRESKFRQTSSPEWTVFGHG